MKNRWADLDPEERERRERQSRGDKARRRREVRQSEVRQSEVRQKVSELKKSHPEKFLGTPEYEAREARNLALAEAQKLPAPSQGGHGICRACFCEVPKTKKGRTQTHTAPGRMGKCPGSGEFTAARAGARPPICAVCLQAQHVRLTDGRIVAHKHQGQRCEGSGRAPHGGRDHIFMKGTGASEVVSGGLPELGRRA